jgi:hypothetical protein
MKRAGKERAQIPGEGALGRTVACGALVLLCSGACGSERDYQEPGAGNGGSGGKGGASNAGKAGTSGKGGASNTAGSGGKGSVAGGSGDGGSVQGGGGAEAGEGGSAGDGGAGTSAAGGSSGAPEGGAGAGGESDPGGSSGNGGGGAGPVCGNGDVEGDEACDDGEDNGLDLLACAPDCSRIIQAKHIVLSDTVDDGRLSPNPVAAADSTCPAGYKALFAYGTSRRATTTAFEIRNPIDWVLQPYTYYLNVNENLVWMTNEVALLGIEDGAFVGLANQPGFATYVIASNMKIDGTTLMSENCQGWNSIQDTESKRYGFPLATDEGYLYNADLSPCGYQIAFYCVEQ